MPDAKDLAFLLLAGFTVLSAVGVAFSRRILYSAFSLLGTLVGTAGLFILLSSDFIAVTQILIYVGGVVVLLIFAVMLTSRIGDVKISNMTVNYKVGIPIAGGIAVFLISLLTSGVWKVREPEVYGSVIQTIGNALLKEYLLPFEVISLVLLGALVGAVVIVRREVK